ncbi:MAG: alpha-galactosidase [Erythrobacter sp.]
MNHSSDNTPAGENAASAAYYELRAAGTFLAIEATPSHRPIIVYAGPDIAGASAADLTLLSTSQHAPGSASVPVPASIMNELGGGMSGPAGFTGHRDGRDWEVYLRVANVEKHGNNRIIIHCEDARLGLAASHTFTIDPVTGILTANTQIENRSDAVFEIDWCAALCLPFNPELSRFLSFTGRWSGEFHIEEIPAFQGSILRENTRGRTSHNVFPGGILAAPETTQTSGPAAAFHLAWSGNHRMRVDRHNDGRGFVQLGALNFPGEVRLAAQETYRTPDMLVAWSNHGFNGASHAFHDYIAVNAIDARSQTKPRPVHYNTWEAVYFLHDEATLIELAENAAKVGAERFVLDDGWFAGRRHDAAGLGDWFVSKDVYPDGLHPLVNRVRELGMEFGLWFEPEMVNPDSDLYRAHPDWVLHASGVDAVPFRGQMTLDLTKDAVFDFLFNAIGDCVTEYAIDYIKWDMNRDTHHPASDGVLSGGRAAMHHQTEAVYRLMRALRDAHPQLEIESCSSGGARADFGVLRHTDRIWTSDNNDARQRQVIQRGASHFFPLRVLGSHVGPKRCHITGRRFTMAFRVATAVFGHMGMELDLRQENPADLAVLKAGIALYKNHRTLIHLGRFWRLDTTPETNAVGCVSTDCKEALFSYAKLDTEVATHPRRLRFAGLDPAMQYRIRIVWPDRNPSISTASIIDAADLMGDGAVFSGSTLMEFGVVPPLIFPDTCLFYHLKSED